MLILDIPYRPSLQNNQKSVPIIGVFLKAGQVFTDAPERIVIEIAHDQNVEGILGCINNGHSATAKEIMTLLQELNQEGHTIIMVTHNSGMEAYSSRTIHLKDGHQVH